MATAGATVVARSEVVPWRYPARRELQFGEWLRHDILPERSEPAVLDHDLAILLTKARQHSLALLGPSAATFSSRCRRSISQGAFRHYCPVECRVGLEG